jgi:hypothetical protein
MCNKTINYNTDAPFSNNPKPARLHFVMITENPSTQAPQLPVTPQMLYPRGGIRVCLDREDEVSGRTQEQELPIGCDVGGGRGRNVRITAVGIAIQGRFPAQAGQDLDGVDPEPRADEESCDVFAASDIWETKVSK